MVLDDDEESSSESMADSRWHHICALWSNEKGDVLSHSHNDFINIVE